METILFNSDLANFHVQMMSGFSTEKMFAKDLSSLQDDFDYEEDFDWDDDDDDDWDDEIEDSSDYE